MFKDRKGRLVEDKYIKAGKLQFSKIKLIAVCSIIGIVAAFFVVIFNMKDSRLYLNIGDDITNQFSEYGIITKSGNVYSNSTNGAKFSCSENIDKIYLIKNTTFTAVTNTSSSTININETIYNSTTLSNLEKFDATLTYNESASGEMEQYPGTYTWDGQAENTEPNAWAIYDDGGTVLVKYNIGGHDNVVELSDSDILNIVALSNSFEPQTSGNISFWIRPDNSYWLQVKFGTDEVFTFNPFDMNVYDDLGIITSYLANTWYYWRFVFDTDSGLYDLYIDGVLITDDGAMDTKPINFFRFYGGLVTTGVFYVDTVSYSWESDFYEDVSDEEEVYMSVTVLNFTFNDNKAIRKNIYNMTIGINQTINGDYIGRIYLIPDQIYNEYFGANVLSLPIILSGNYTGNLPIPTNYVSYLTNDIPANFTFITFGISLSSTTEFLLNANVSGYFWKTTSEFEFTTTNTLVSTAQMETNNTIAQVEINNEKIIVTTIVTIRHTVQYNAWIITNSFNITTVITIDIAKYIFAINEFNTKAQTFFGFRAVELTINNVDFNVLAIDYNLGAGRFLFN